MKSKITLKDYFSSVNHSITYAGAFGWDCYGDNAFQLDYEKKQGGEFVFSVSVVFSADNQIVYEMEVWDYKKNKQHRWINPKYSNKQREESIKRGLRPEHSTDGLSFIDVKADTILSKAKELCQAKTKSAKKKKC